MNSYGIEFYLIVLILTFVFYYCFYFLLIGVYICLPFAFISFLSTVQDPTLSRLSFNSHFQTPPPPIPPSFYLITRSPIPPSFSPLLFYLTSLPSLLCKGEEKSTNYDFINDWCVDTADKEGQEEEEEEEEDDFSQHNL